MIKFSDDQFSNDNGLSSFTSYAIPSMLIAICCIVYLAVKSTTVRMCACKPKFKVILILFLTIQFSVMLQFKKCLMSIEQE